MFLFTAISLICLIVAIISLIMQAFNYQNSRFSIGWIGLAFLALGLLFWALLALGVYAV